MARNMHFKVGSLDCWAVSDAAEQGIELMDNWRFTASKSAIDQALAEHRLEPDSVPIDWLCLLVKTAGQYVLVDTGSGPGINANVGQLFQNLRALGIEARDIGTVIISHSHFDHIGGTLTADGQSAFSNARVVLGEGERRLLELKPPVPPALYESAQRYLPALANQLEYVADGVEILAGVRAVAMPGHTPGSTAIEISSGSTHLLFTGDLFYHAMQVEHPDWCSQYDLDPAQAIASRKKIYRMAVDDKVLILPAHAPLPGIGHIIWDGASYRWRPIV
jgi:glyoxylase-like metal-dependent hydrolase (beta-lactamase superfamily II)